MNITTISSRAFNQDVGGAKRAADSGPVFITDRGRPAYVLIRHEEWQRLAGERQSIRLALDMPGIDTIEFEPPRLSGPFTRPADFE